MYAPARSKSSYVLEAWAESWLARDNGWESKTYEVANYDPIRYRQICESCTVVEVAHAWKTKMACSEFAWSDMDALRNNVTWIAGG